MHCLGRASSAKAGKDTLDLPELSEEPEMYTINLVIFISMKNLLLGQSLSHWIRLCSNQRKYCKELAI